MLYWSLQVITVKERDQSKKLCQFDFRAQLVFSPCFSLWRTHHWVVSGSREWSRRAVCTKSRRQRSTGRTKAWCRYRCWRTLCEWSVWRRPGTAGGDTTTAATSSRPPSLKTTRGNIQWSLFFLDSHKNGMMGPHENMYTSKYPGWKKHCVRRPSCQKCGMVDRPEIRTMGQISMHQWPKTEARQQHWIIVECGHVFLDEGE